MEKDCVGMEYKAQFAKYSNMSMSEQIACKDEIVDLFTKFWTGKTPSLELFSTCLSRIVVFPELFYIMITSKAGG